MRRTRSLCCARAASGHAAALPRAPRNSRRLILAPGSGVSIVSAQWSALIGAETSFAAAT